MTPAEPRLNYTRTVRQFAAGCSMIGVVLHLLTGCATSHPRIVSVGPDTYRLTFAGNAIGGDKNAAMAMSAASAFCAQMHTHVLLKTSSESGTNTRSPLRDTVTFQCLNADDSVYSSLFDSPIKLNPAHPVMIHPEYYTRASRLAHEEGACVVRVTVNADGTPHDPSIERSSGYPRLDQACLDVITGYATVPIFIPAMKNGKSVQATTTVPINWTLDKY